MRDVIELRRGEPMGAAEKLDEVLAAAEATGVQPPGSECGGDAELRAAINKMVATWQTMAGVDVGAFRAMGSKTREGLLHRVDEMLCDMCNEAAHVNMAFVTERVPESAAAFQTAHRNAALALRALRAAIAFANGDGEGFRREPDPSVCARAAAALAAGTNATHRVPDDLVDRREDDDDHLGPEESKSFVSWLESGGDDPCASFG